MSQKAFEQFNALPIGTLFTSTAEWGERDAFIKSDAEHYRRSYDYITWNAADTEPGFGLLGDGGVKELWPALVTMDEVPQWISSSPPLTDDECREREAADHKRLREYVEATGELPEQGWW